MLVEGRLRSRVALLLLLATPDDTDVVGSYSCLCSMGIIPFMRHRGGMELITWLGQGVGVGSW